MKELPIIIKADVQGSAEVLADTLTKLSDERVKIRIIHTGVGAINESDVLLATASNAIIIGFNVRPDRNAAEVAEREKVDIRQHSIIYNVTDEMKKAMAGLLEPTLKETRLGAAEVRQIFKTPKVGTIAGCMVLDGRITRGGDAQARLLRDNVVVWHGQDRLAAPLQGRRQRSQGRASSAASRSTGSTTSRSATSSRSSRWRRIAQTVLRSARIRTAAHSIDDRRPALARAVPAHVAVAEGQAHGAAAAQGSARARSTSRSRKSRIRTSGSAPGSASSPWRRRTTMAGADAAVGAATKSSGSSRGSSRAARWSILR